MNQAISSSVSVLVVNAPRSYVGNYGEHAGQTRYNTSSLKMEIYDGMNWQPDTTGPVSIGLTAQAETILAWAAVKMEEERTLKIKLEKYPTLKYAYDQYKMVEGLVYDSEYTSS